MWHDLYLEDFVPLMLNPLAYLSKEFWSYSKLFLNLLLVIGILLDILNKIALCLKNIEGFVSICTPVVLECLFFFFSLLTFVVSGLLFAVILDCNGLSETPPRITVLSLLWGENFLCFARLVCKIKATDSFYHEPQEIDLGLPSLPLDSICAESWVPDSHLNSDLHVCLTAEFWVEGVHLLQFQFVL